MSQIEFTEKELAAIRAEYCKGASDTQFDLFISECKNRGLYPGRHLVFQFRKSKEYDETTGAWVYVKKPYWITTIQALLLIAEETGKYDGASAPEYIYLDQEGEPTVVSEIPLASKENRSLPREPWAVRVKIRRKDFSQPIVSIVRFDSVAATQKRDNTIVLTDMWVKRGVEQNAKCALANGIRVAFPERAGNLFLSEEIKNEVEDEKPQSQAPASVVLQLPVVPKVNQTPATPTDAPRPNETVKVSEVIQTTALPPAPPVDPALTEALLKAKTAVPELKAAAELPPPPKKKTGRPSKTSPGTGRDVAAEGGITQADVDNVEQNSAPVVDEAAEKAAAEEFVASVDPTPTKEEMTGFTTRVRALATAGAVNADLKNYILAVGKKNDPKELTVRDWNEALEKLEAAQQAGTLKEVTKNAPLPAF